MYTSACVFVNAPYILFSRLYWVQLLLFLLFLFYYLFFYYDMDRCIQINDWLIVCISLQFRYVINIGLRYLLYSCCFFSAEVCCNVNSRCSIFYGVVSLVDLQYGARDKFLSGVVGGRTASESVANEASAACESLAKVKRIVTDSPQKLELSAASPPSGRCH